MDNGESLKKTIKSKFVATPLKRLHRRGQNEGNKKIYKISTRKHLAKETGWDRTRQKDFKADFKENEIAKVWIELNQMESNDEHL